MPELWGMRSIPLLPSFPGSHRLGVVTPDRVLSMGQIELNCVLSRIVWNRTVLHLTERKLKTVVYMYKNGFGIK